MLKKIFIFIAFFFIMGNTVHAEDWKVHKSRHFLIYYNEAPRDFVENVEDMAEHYFRKITQDLGFSRTQNWTFDKRAEIYIYDDQSDYLARGRSMSWSHGMASPRSKMIKTFPTAHGFFDSTLPHELGHIIFREYVGLDADLPVWLEEGVAMYQEQARRFGAHEEVRKAKKEGRFIPLEGLTFNKLYRNNNSLEVVLFYTESASIMNFLIDQYGRHRFRRLCQRIKEGDSFDQALAAVYPRIRSVEDLAKMWESFLENP